jgi:spermidine synthase
MLTSRDNFLYHEMLTHPALFSHPDPKRVLIIGGGDCGTLSEVLRHSGVETCTQVEIDETVTRLAENYFPELCQRNDDPRARLRFDDGLAHIKNAEPGSLDLIIVDSTDPIGPAEGLFGPGFVADCYAALAEGGILVQQSESPLLHHDLIRGIRGNMKEAGFSDIQTLGFPQPCYPSGWWSATQACKGDVLRAADADRFEASGLTTRYYNPEVHRGALATQWDRASG